MLPGRPIWHFCWMGSWRLIARFLGAFHQAIPACRVEFFAWCLKCPNKGMPSRPSNFWISCAWVLICVWLPIIKWPCVIYWLGGKLVKYILIFLKMIVQGWAEKFIGWCHICSWLHFWLMGSRYCNTDGLKWSEWTAKGTILKN